MRYLEFAAASNFSFLRGASHPEELMVQAAHIGIAGLGLCDRNSVAGVVRAHLAKREQNLSLRYHPGARLVFADGTPDILVYPRDRSGWGRLTRLLTLGNLRAEKSECILRLDDLLSHVFGLELIVMGGPARLLARLREAAPHRVRLAASMPYRGRDRARLARTRKVARDAQVPLIAVNDVLYHHPDRRPLADVITCIREKTTIDRAGRKLAVNAERYLKPPQEMLRLFHDAPEAIEETIALSDALSFSLDSLRYEYPDEEIKGFDNAQDALTHLTYEGAARRYPQGLPDKVRVNLEHELKLIAQLQYAPYFLTVYNIVNFARSQNILCQGRGSAANSAVCFCLGVTEVDPDRADLLFERFISPERNEPPDIDIDFEHERREEVIQYIYRRYGRERAALAATVIRYRARSAVRDVARALGLPEDQVAQLSRTVGAWSTDAPAGERLREYGFDPASALMQRLHVLVVQLLGKPRHLSQHVGGFVISEHPLHTLVPVENAAMDDRTIIQWDKDDLDTMKLLKVDVLALGMLTCIRKALDLVHRHRGEHLTTATIPAEDPATYAMIQRGDVIGVFQIESRAQMAMLPRLKPETFYDLVIEVAIVRPGPIQGGMVHPYLRRRQGLEPVDYPSEALRNVLQRTLGVPLFQEQVMRIAMEAAGYTPGQADQLRRDMAAWKRHGGLEAHRERLLAGMAENGYA